MPWSGEHGADDGGDDALDDLGPLPTPPSPDDRLWRHPSELSWPAATATPPRPPASSPRLWGVAVTSGLTGAVLALGVVALVSGLGRVTERVVERVPMGDPLVDVAAKTNQRTVPTVAAAVSPSVVRLDVETRAGTITGSGVVFRDDGTILTNAHVVSDATRVTIVLPDGSGVAGDVVGTDRFTDVAIVRASDGRGGDVEWVPAVLGSASGLAVGETAIAIGSPLGLAGGPSVTLGVVSGLDRRVSAAGIVLHGMIQTDAPIALGSSGGALCNASGVVIAITTALATSEDGLDGLGFAIPMDVARGVAEDLLGGGDVDHAWLGIEGTDLGPTEASVPGIAGIGGVRVTDLEPGGPAAVAGIGPGDVVLRIGERRVATMTDLVTGLRQHRPGERVLLTVRRNGEVLEVAVDLGER